MWCAPASVSSHSTLGIDTERPSEWVLGPQDDLRTVRWKGARPVRAIRSQTCPIKPDHVLLLRRIFPVMDLLEMGV